MQPVVYKSMSWFFVPILRIRNFLSSYCSIKYWILVMRKAPLPRVVIGQRKHDDAEWMNSLTLVIVTSGMMLWMPVQKVRVCHITSGCAVECCTYDQEVVGSNLTYIYCVSVMPTQHATPVGSVNEYQWKLGSKWTYHTMHWYCIRCLLTSADFWLRTNETVISAALRPLRKDFTYA